MSKRHKKSHETEQSKTSLERKDKELFSTSCLRLFEEETLCEVTLLVGAEKEKIRAHKVFLIARSEVFRAMFCGNYAEASGEVEIPDIHPSTLKILLRYMYTGEFEDITNQNVTALLYAAEKYRLSSFADKVEQVIIQSLNYITLSSALNLATQYYKESLLKECLLTASIYGSSFLKSKKFLSLTSVSLTALVKSDHQCADENEMYMACKRWAENKCQINQMEINPANVRQCLGAILFSIRFTTMDIETFSTNVSIGNILTDGEKVALFNSIIHKSTEYKKFNFTGESKRYKRERIKCVEKGTTTCAVMKNPCDSIVLKYSQDTLLLFVSLFIPMKDTQIFNGVVHLVIVEQESATVLHGQRSSMLPFSGPGIGDVFIKPSFKLRANINYKVSIRFEGSNLKMRQGPGLSNKVFGPDDKVNEKLKLQKAQAFGNHPFKGAMSVFHSLNSIKC